MSSTITASDYFAGAGGASQGLHDAGVEVVIAANHWRLAVETHNTNFPQTDHDCADLSQVDPKRHPTTTIGWFSPECTNHSIASAASRRQNDAIVDGEGNRLPEDAAERSRATMWDVVRFSEYHRYKAVIVENVVDAAKWVLFEAWLTAMRNLGYEYEVVYLNSMFVGGEEAAPQSRDRMYVVFWQKGVTKPDLDIRPDAWCGPCDKQVASVQTFKKARWGRYNAQYNYRCPDCTQIVHPYVRPAASAIDWTLPGQRIGDRDKPYAAGTIARIQAGLDKFGLQHLVVPVERGNAPESKRARTVSEPFATQTTRATTALAFTPFIASQRGGGSKTKCDPVTGPMGTVSAGGNHHQLITPPGFVMRNNGSRGAGSEHCTPFTEPMRTLTTLGHQSVVQATPPALLVPYNRTGVAHPVTDPLWTVTTHDREALVRTAVTVEDCSLRMLQPHEVGAGMAFGAGYIVLGNKREMVRQYGNAVTPPAAKVLVERVVTALNATAPVIPRKRKPSTRKAAATAA